MKTLYFFCAFIIITFFIVPEAKATLSALNSTSERLIGTSGYSVYNSQTSLIDTSIFTYQDTTSLNYSERTLYLLGTPYQHYIRTYDNRNNMLSEIRQDWHGTFQNQANAVYVYDGDNNLTSQAVQTWDTAGQAWTTQDSVIYSYNAGNKKIRKLVKYQSQGIWHNQALDTFAYDAHNNLIQDIYLLWTSGAWANNANYQYSYDAGGRQVSNIFQIWSTGSGWTNSGKDTLIYNTSGDLAQDIYLEWQTSSSSFILYTDILYTYDANHNMTSYINQDHNGSGWINDQRHSYLYDSYNNITRLTSEQWQNGAWGFLNSSTSDAYNYYFYEAYTSTGVGEISGTARVSVYPSPAHAILNIDIHWDQEQSATLAIYDASGRLWDQSQVPVGTSYVGQIAVASWPAGIYYLIAKGTHGQITKPFLVNR
ncbi:MAG: hypothetical protein JWO03_2356 [Bacteroidetes bacterium]|nr:hypothetical protein [Bacteroidota bacterium]